MLTGVWLAALLLATAGGLHAANGDGYVGSETCFGCHEEMQAAHAESLHARAWASQGSPYQGSGCESCHGPGSRHAENPSRETIVTFGKDSLQSAEEQSAQCFECHSAMPYVSLWEMGQHQKNDVACSACHSIHKGPSPLPKQPETCFNCHQNVRFQANKQSHHPIIEGKVQCGDCHNPHGTLSHGMIKAETINLLCYTCHADKRGPFVWEHPSVEENCATCHEPHGSRHIKLLTEKMPNLCQDCHDWSRHPGTAYDTKAEFTGIANASTKGKFVARSCLNCHTNIHGSNAPGGGTAGGGKFFTR